jgi:hypothetical protein
VRSCRLTAVALAALALAACGGGEGGDDPGPQQVVRDFVKATAAGDSERLCEDILTPEFIASATGANEGETAACKRQLDVITGLRISLVRIGRTEIDGDDARVAAVLRLQGQRQPRVFRLKRQDGEWRLAGGSGAAG